mgnify:CR=1 FL=1
MILGTQYSVAAEAQQRTRAPEPPERSLLTLALAFRRLAETAGQVDVFHDAAPNELPKQGVVRNDLGLCRSEEL